MSSAQLHLTISSTPARSLRLGGATSSSASASPDQQLRLDIASHDPPRPQLRELLEELEVNNALGYMVTYDVASRKWVDWDRPNRLFLNGATRPVAASGLESYFDENGYSRPLCPHAANGFRQDCEMHARRKTYKGKVTWVMQARHDGYELGSACQFIMEVPDLPKNMDLVLRDLHIPGRRPLRKKTGLSRYPTKGNLCNHPYSFPSSSTSGASSNSCASSPTAATRSRQRQSPEFGASPSSSTSSRIYASSSTSSIVHARHASPTEVDAILNAMQGRIVNMREINKQYGRILDHVYRIEKLLDPICPSRDHKLANRNMPPLILMPYHSISSPEPFTLLAFNNSAIGRAVRTWNSPAGVSLDAWDLIVQSNVLCPQCSSCYSIDGFHDHLEEGTCTNGLGPALFNRVDVDKFPTALPNHLRQCNPNLPEEILAYHPSTSPPPCEVFSASMVGRAMMEWNSRKGISLKVWHLVATAYVVCKGCCDLIRSLDGDCAHRSFSGVPLCQVEYMDISDDEEGEVDENENEKENEDWEEAEAENTEMD